MTKRELVEEMFIHAPVDTVWSIYDDLSWKPRLDPGLIEYVGIGDGPKTVGKRHRFAFRSLFGKRVEFEDEILEYVPPRRITIRADGGFGLVFQASLDLKERSGATLCVRRVTLQVPLFMLPIRRLVVRSAREGSKTLLTNLKRFAEEKARGSGSVTA